ncbi:MAG: hypothetical protein QOH96_793 [Blastocatellia bacterium]|nr:hypothetical protein [Blastocatellia bacterium]
MSRRRKQRGRAASKKFRIAEVTVFQDSVRLVAIKISPGKHEVTDLHYRRSR